MDYSVHTPYMRTLQAKLKAVHDSIPTHGTGTTQTFDANLVGIGTDAFTPGKEVETTIAATSKAIGARTVMHSKALHALYKGLDDLINTTDHAESLVDMSVETWSDRFGDPFAGSTTTTTTS
ncbi:hypothetical protein [Actinoplanes sp. NPDC026619]|uniref:hypothetical protein n=1 Tax=Actinoplanes sp. NPDC026619 TaxID=3155798 RepID=UPI0033DFFFB2